MAAKLTPAQREEAVLKAWQMCLRGATTTKIGRSSESAPRVSAGFSRRHEIAPRSRMRLKWRDTSAEFIGEQEPSSRRPGDVSIRPATTDERGQHSEQHHLCIQEYRHGTRCVCRAKGYHDGGAAIAWTDLVKQLEAEEKQSGIPAASEVSESPIADAETIGHA